MTGAKILNAGLANGKILGLKLITFDVTGTLLKFRKNPAEIYADFGAKHGIVLEADDLKKSFRTQWSRMTLESPHFGNCWRSWWTEFVVRTFQGANVQANEKTLTKIATELIEHFSTKECWEVKDGVTELLSTIKRSNSTKIGVLSNFDPRLRKILIETKLHPFFDFILTSHECQISKPDVRIFAMALQQSFAQSQEALHIGDNYDLDFVGAVNAGWNSLLVIPPEQLAGPDPKLSNILESKPQIIFSNLDLLRRFLYNS